MIRSELYKLRTMRTPLVCTAALLIGVLAPSVVLLLYTPKDSAIYTSNFSGVYSVLAGLLGVVFGGWLLGTEYRQHTVKRLLTSEPRRGRALATKGLVGAAAMSAVLAVTGAVGWVAARYVGSMNDVTVPWPGREMLAAALTALALGAVAYCLSAITRSDSFAMVGTVSLIFILEPLLSLIPRVGKFRLGSALDHMSQSVSGEQMIEITEMSGSTATLVLVAWIATLASVGATLFARRDV